MITRAKIPSVINIGKGKRLQRSPELIQVTFPNYTMKKQKFSIKLIGVLAVL